MAEGAGGAVMRLMVVILIVVFLIIVDLSWYRGTYLSRLARLSRQAGMVAH